MEPPPDEDVLVLPSPPVAAVGVDTIVRSIVTTPAVPDETLFETEVTGSRDDAAAALAEDGAADEEGSGVFEGELPPPVPDARPVKLARVG